VGRGLGGAALAPQIVAEPPQDADDHDLVAAVRRGDDRAFEVLYERYQRRIAAYVMGMVKDHGRAEDITQEVFVSALRRMRETERPIAFKPWIYEIAKNACIDQFRRSRRAEEVSFDAQEGLAPADYGRLVGSDPTPDAAVAAKQELEDLCGAFGGLSESHHEILVLRELEGLSYREIGERMGMSRPAVESTLFRARRRLSEEYDELVTGARCRRIQSVIADAGDRRLGARDSRRLARHVAHCQPCRREALAAGLDAAVLKRTPLRRRAAAKVAALLPFPGFLRFGRDRSGDEAAASIAGSASSSGQAWMAQLPMISDGVGAGWAKMAAAAAVLVAGVGGAGVGPHTAPDRDGAAARTDRNAAAEQRPADSNPARSASGSRFTAGASTAGVERDAQNGRTWRSRERAGTDRATTRRDAGSRGLMSAPQAGGGKTGGTAPAAGGGGGTSHGAPASPGHHPSGPSAPATIPKAPAGGGEADTPSTPDAPEVPAVEIPTGGDAPAEPPVEEPTEPVQPPVEDIPETVDGATGGADPVTGAVEGAAGDPGALLPPP
jgi:RNA polymerase sigma factor (sigma-70 family)